MTAKKEPVQGICSFCKNPYEMKSTRQLFCTPNCQKSKMIEMSNMNWVKRAYRNAPKKGANSPPKFRMDRDDS